MKYETVIRESIENDGTGVSEKFLADLVMAEIRQEKVYLFHYDKVVMTVDAKGPYPEMHLYTSGMGTTALRCGNRFMKDLWEKVPHDVIFARTKNPKVVRFAEIFGWERIGNYPEDYAVYKIERSMT